MWYLFYRHPLVFQLFHPYMYSEELCFIVPQNRTNTHRNLKTQAPTTPIGVFYKNPGFSEPWQEQIENLFA